MSNISFAYYSNVMSVIRFTCDHDKKEEVKKGVWSILHEHYFDTVKPHSKEEYEDEGEDVYHERLQALMESELCHIEDTKDGFSFEFNATEEAGFAIPKSVYHTNMGYNDNGLTYLDPMFDEIVKQFPDICFEAETECIDKWGCERYRYVYNGVELTIMNLDEEDMGDEEPAAIPEDHFTYNVPRIYVNDDALGMLIERYPRGATEEFEKTGRIDPKLTIMECVNGSYITVWTPATEEAIAEAVATGYPESMGAVAFMIMYEGYSDGIITEDFRAVRAVVVEDNTSVGFSEARKGNLLSDGALNGNYLAVIGLQHFLVENNLYDTYASLNAKESGMIVSVKDDQLVAKVVPIEDYPKFDRGERSNIHFGFYL